MVKRYAAIGGTVILGGLVLFQLLLAAGLPLGRAAWGGQYAVLPTGMRVGSLAAACVLAFAAWVLLARARVIAARTRPIALKIVTWFFTAYLLLNALGNLASKSPVERLVMTPLSLLLAVCFAIVALG